MKEIWTERLTDRGRRVGRASAVYLYSTVGVVLFSRLGDYLGDKIVAKRFRPGHTTMLPNHWCVRKVRQLLWPRIFKCSFVWYFLAHRANGGPLSYWRDISSVVRPSLSVSQKLLDKSFYNFAGSLLRSIPGNLFFIFLIKSFLEFWWFFWCFSHVNEWEFLTWALMEIFQSFKVDFLQSDEMIYFYFDMVLPLDSIDDL